MNHHRRRLWHGGGVLAILLFFVGTAVRGDDRADVLERLERATRVFYEVMEVPEEAIPQALLDRAACVVILPGVKKGGFIFAGMYGRGFISCRKRSGTGWSAPAGIRLEGGSFGLQIGGAESDVILLVMNRRGAERLLKSKFTLGGEASVAAGPVGRDTKAETDALLTAQILSWSRSRGVFAGVALKGSTLRPDREVNKILYGRELESATIIEQELPPPEPAKQLLSLLNKYSPVEVK